MTKLAEVEEAKALMTEAMQWSVMKWLTNKKKVRRAADKANEILWAKQKEIKSCWSDELKLVYAELAGHGNNPGAKPAADHQQPSASDPEVRLLAKRIREADEAAHRAHVDAEETFEKAEKILSTAMSREGCRKAIHSWELYEKAILKAEAGIRVSSS